MHSFAPIAGITSRSWSSVDAEAAPVEARRPPRGTPRGRGWRGRCASRGWRRRAAPPRRSAGTSACRGRRSPSVITSMPAARFAAILRSSWANRYGGMRSRRSLCLIELLAEVVGERAREHGHRPAGQGHVQILPDLDRQLAAVEAHDDLGAARRRGGRRPPRRSRRSPRRASRRRRARRSARGSRPGSSSRYQETLVRLGNSAWCSIAGPIAGEVERLELLAVRSRTAGCRSRRAGSASSRPSASSSPRPSGGAGGKVGRARRARARCRSCSARAAR